MRIKIVLWLFLALIEATSWQIANSCSFPVECQMREYGMAVSEDKQNYILCQLSSSSRSSRLEFDLSENGNCSLDSSEIRIQPYLFDSMILDPKYLNIVSLIDFVGASFKSNDQTVTFSFFKGFTLDDEYENKDLTRPRGSQFVKSLYFGECVFDFYLPNDGRRVDACADIQDSTRLSIFQLLSSTLRPSFVYLELAKHNRKLCPLVFKYFRTDFRYILGYNSLYSR